MDRKAPSRGPWRIAIDRAYAHCNRIAAWSAALTTILGLVFMCWSRVQQAQAERIEIARHEQIRDDKIDSLTTAVGEGSKDIKSLVSRVDQIQGAINAMTHQGGDLRSTGLSISSPALNVGGSE